MKKKVNTIIEKRKTNVKKFLKDVWVILNKPYMMALPGQIAFFLILSLVPIVTLIGYGASLFNISIDSIIELIKTNFSDNIVNMIVPIIDGKTIDAKLLIIIITMAYLSSNAADSIIFSANEIYGCKQTSWIKRRIKAILMTLLIVVLYLFILLVPVFGEKIINAIDYFNIKSVITSILEIMQGPISWLIIFIFIKVIFTMAPNKSIPASQINLGAIFTAAGWIITTEIYSYYISHFARYDIFYAGLSNIAVLMLWIYFLSCILVIGLSLTVKFDNDEMEKTGRINIIKND